MLVRIVLQTEANCECHGCGGRLVVYKLERESGDIFCRKPVNAIQDITEVFFVPRIKRDEFFMKHFVLEAEAKLHSMDCKLFHNEYASNS
jgi:hypothetical protein